MASKKIIWSDHAKIELKEMLDFFIKRNGSSTYSLKILNEIEELLESYPRMN